MTRVAVLLREDDRRLGKVAVPDQTFVIQHQDSLFVRSAEAVRLAGGGIGVIFRETDVYVRDKLEPA